MRSLENKWLIVDSGVLLNDNIDGVIAKLDEWFSFYMMQGFVTSGERTRESQFEIIRREAMRRGYQKKYPKLIGATIETKTMFAGGVVPVWLPCWGLLLKSGFLVNPPEEAAVPFDYVHPKSGKKVLAGTKIKASRHIAPVKAAFDIGGRGGLSKTMEDELFVIDLAFKSGEIKGMIGYTAERNNNCVHIDCESR